MGQKFIGPTNKAEFHHLPDGSLVKRYVARGPSTRNPSKRALEDQRSLSHIQKHFGEICYEGWRYSVVKLLWSNADQGLICMEFVPADTVSNIHISKMKAAEYHCGIWIAFYHKNILNDDLEGLTYKDLSVHNMIIDFENKRVVAIDPGARWGRLGYVYEDLLGHITSVLVLVLKRKAPLSAVLSFLKGYTHIANRKPKLSFYYKSLFREVRRSFLQYKRKSVLKFICYVITLTILSGFYLGLLPVYLYIKALEPKL